MLRVLFVSPFFEPAWYYGGTVRAASSWAHAFSTSGQNIVYVYTTTANGNRELDTEDNVTIDIDGVQVVYFKRQKGTHKRFVSLQMLPALFRNIPSFDLIHIIGLWTFGGLIASRICMLKRVPYIISLHGLLMPWAYNYHKYRKKLFMSLFERHMLKKASGIICSTEMEKRNFLALNISDKVQVISNITEPPDIDMEISRKRFRETHGLANSLVLLFAGRIVENKGLHLTVEAFSKIAKHYPNACLFAMGLEEDDFLKKVKKQIKFLKLEHRFHYLGMLTGSDYWDAMAGADLFVLNSYSENFGNVVIEALSVGLPVLISDQVGIGDLVKQYSAGQITTLDPNDIAAKMIMMLSQSDKIKEMGRRGIKLVHENCTPDVVGRQLKKYCGEIVKIHRFGQNKDKVK
jgi:glycosyltransferase involved in cell wall biosynthesis